MIRIKLFLITVIFFLMVPLLYAEGEEGIDYPYTDTIIRLPLADLPYNAEDGYTFPSMNQSLMITKGAMQASHSIVWDLTDSRGGFVQWLSLIVWDYFFFQLPGGTAWVHEEWHRAVMGQYGISSRNDVYSFDLGAEAIYVSHVKDSELAWLKENSNPDMVRLMAAGNEAEVQLARALRRESFFTGRPIYLEIPALWMSLANASYYVIFCSTKGADSDTDHYNEIDVDNVEARDFTGLDFTAWIYDLNRPDELYSDRGVHPSGTGIDRYVRYSDLTDSEKKYLRMTGCLTLLNFISPQLFGFERFTGRDPFTGDVMRWNIMVLHNLTSFGNDVSLNFLMREGELNLELALHSYFNKEHYSPGIEAGIHRYPFAVAGWRIYGNTGMIFFLQPRDHEFHTGEREAGAWFSAGLDVPIIEGKLELYVEGDVKSDGWVAGNVYLDEQAQGRAGVSYLY